ncbi:MAG TPA: hypothetical protein VJP80_04255 [Candidatus Saccharimonadales bacterium]|nr:hypothetical protein [Candidatus Saccharimonadales bacterium]
MRELQPDEFRGYFTTYAGLVAEQHDLTGLTHVVGGPLEAYLVQEAGLARWAAADVCAIQSDFPADVVDEGTAAINLLRHFQSAPALEPATREHHTARYGDIAWAAGQLPEVCEDLDRSTAMRALEVRQAAPARDALEPFGISESDARATVWHLNMADVIPGVTIVPEGFAEAHNISDVEAVRSALAEIANGDITALAPQTTDRYTFIQKPGVPGKQTEIDRVLRSEDALVLYGLLVREQDEVGIVPSDTFDAACGRFISEQETHFDPEQLGVFRAHALARVEHLFTHPQQLVSAYEALTGNDVRTELLEQLMASGDARAIIDHLGQPYRTLIEHLIYDKKQGGVALDGIAVHQPDSRAAYDRHRAAQLRLIQSEDVATTEMQ